MKNWMGRCALLSMFVALAGPARADDSVEDVGKQIAKAAKGMKSFQADMQTVMEMSQEGYSMKSTTTGTIEYLRDKDMYKARMESKGTSETSIAGNTNASETASLMISDGTYSYTLTEMAGMKQAYKSKAEPIDDNPIKSMQEGNNLALMPDESIEGRAVWVIKATPKDNTAGQGHSMMYYDKQTGQMLKMVVYTPDGSPMSTTTFSNIRVNESISGDRFVWTTPPGVTVVEN